MKLYYAPGSCSLAVHIALKETGQVCELAKVDVFTKAMDDGGDYRTVNPRGALPALALDEGGVLTEVAVLLQYVADKAGNVLIPAAGTLERYRVLEWLNHLATELHKSFSVLFNPVATDDFKQFVQQKLIRHFAEIDAVVGREEWLANGAYSVADIYAFVISNWAGMVGIDLSEFVALEAFRSRIAARPAVVAALQVEGLA
ncbi:glutathione S-transferase [Caenibius tardaugens NBRC 16725]|uniref:Glutathione S-transferase n=1 Tax=Caenibius tardaugens NBRC 16725 TaxID=1219035 RepID=U2ZXV4_9SPHN|nr:glutathione transferase GstA [Caenibius tardaugens]AZI37399.1 glutathione transferase GstA [Caenibius tardaugens NBRC 16725]GAD47338.1 glutathione S-transferase [Caenibius tardaugens NBRC 16725]